MRKNPQACGGSWIHHSKVDASNADMKQLTMTLQEECCWRSKRYDPVELFSMTGSRT
jgi:hypothetical protein